jgi:hypothetical protein
MVRGGGAVGGRFGGLLRGVFGGRVAAFLTSKSMVAAAILAGLAVSSYGLFDIGRRGGIGVEAPRSASGFRSSYSPDSAASLYASGSPSSGLDYAQQANRGAFADGEGAGSGEAAQDAAGAAETSPEVPSADAAAGAAPDAAAAAAAAAAGTGKGLANAGYGKFSSASGGLGGGGAWGGVGQAFSQPKLGNTQLAQARAFSPSNKASVRRMNTARNLGRSGMKGATARRLDNMNRAMSATKSGNAETAAASQTQQWSNAAPAGSSVQGAGVGGSPTSGAFVPGSGLEDGGPVGSGTPTPSTEVPSAGEGKNVTPYQGMVDMATIMLMAASVLLLLSYLVGMLGKTYPMAYTIAKYLAYAAMACAAITAIMGVAIMAQGGQAMQGLIFTGVGALLTYISYTAAEGNAQAAEGQAAAQGSAQATAAGDAGAQSVVGGSGSTSGAASAPAASPAPASAPAASPAPANTGGATAAPGM